MSISRKVSCDMEIQVYNSCIKLLGPEHLDTLTSMNDLATTSTFFESKKMRNLRSCRCKFQICIQKTAGARTSRYTRGSQSEQISDDSANSLQTVQQTNFSSELWELAESLLNLNHCEMPLEVLHHQFKFWFSLLHTCFEVLSLPHMF
jgi:hypothetical protein